VSLLDDAFAPEPGRTAPSALNADERLVGPFVRYELIEDRYAKVINRNMIGVPEFLALGLASTVQLGWASTALGSSHDALLYEGSVSRGFVPSPEQTLLASASIEGQYTDGHVRKQLFGVEGKYYLQQSKRWLFYAAASGDMLTNPDVLDMLLLGGDNGLRGYPLRYQAGDKRALVTLEERIYSNLFVWNLFRVGAAAFVDVGRAWGGPHVNTVNPGWLADAGVGLRLSSVRLSTKDVVHIDIAFPFNAHPRHQEGAGAGQGQGELLKPSGSGQRRAWNRLAGMYSGVSDSMRLVGDKCGLTPPAHDHIRLIAVTRRERSRLR
jgi:hypothetical protein